MSKRNHSIGLKLFIFLLVAMMLFSAIGVMVIYLNVPTQTTTAPAVLPAEPTTITLPSTAGEEPTAAVDENAPAEDPTQPEAVVADEEQPTPTEDVANEPTPTNQPTEEAPAEAVLPAQE